MPKKPKFKPIITRIKLNPEQAVLACACYMSGRRWYTAGTRDQSASLSSVCSGSGKVGAGSTYYCPTPGSGGAYTHIAARATTS